MSRIGNNRPVRYRANLPKMESSDEAECSNIDYLSALSSGPVKKRRFSDVRIQPTRIKKVMQSDDEIGRMVASVPVAIGSAMELFAEKLILSAASCLQYSSTKTLSPMHIKYAICRDPQFSFLEYLLKEVPFPKLNLECQEAMEKTM